ncbi:MAG: carboxypeptidase M32 [Candidatus Heimdallarchaeota archaeon]|nr:carboxypeptidase M32 [Candidatus Heimdallarchaeota archaeon]
MKDKYNQLLDLYKEIQVVGQIGMLLGWDTEVLMPKGGIIQRSEQQGYVARLNHKLGTNPTIGELLRELKESEDYDKLSEVEKRNIHLIQKDYDKVTKLPEEFVVEYTKTSVMATEAWKKARAENNFVVFQPHLEKVFEMTKKYANYINPETPPYEVLLDDFEPGMSSEKYTEIFNPLKEATFELIRKCRDAPNQPNTSLINRKVPLDVQDKISKDLASLIDFNLEKGRIDVSTHPFTTGDYDDVRITTRYMEEDFTSSFFSVMHEGGHGCYDQNQAEKFRYQPIGNYCSLGLHESQSRFYENTLGRSKSFWFYYLDRFKELTGDIFSDVQYEEFIRAINAVEPSFIRVEADEVTYNLHIILRFEIERDLFAGKIEIKDLPQVWKDKMKEMLGIEVEKDSDGVLQDIHWSGGTFGYFPTYSLGNIYAAQFFNKLTEDIPDWNIKLESGDVSSILTWMKTNVQEKGNLYDAPELVKVVTGEYPTPKYLIDFLNKKYSVLYGI